MVAKVTKTCHKQSAYNLNMDCFVWPSSTMRKKLLVRRTDSANRNATEKNSLFHASFSRNVTLTVEPVC